MEIVFGVINQSLESSATKTREHILLSRLTTNNEPSNFSYSLTPTNSDISSSFLVSHRPIIILFHNTSTSQRFVLLLIALSIISRNASIQAHRLPSVLG